MLLPRPEIRIATRRGSPAFRSGMMSDGPVLARAPAAGRAADRAAAPAAFDMADQGDGFAGSLEGLDDRLGFGLGDDRRHADAAVEGPRHFRRGELSAAGKKREDRRQLPAFRIYDGVA